VEREVALGPVVEPATVVRHSQELASHVVQFYESDEYLARIVAEFFAEGLSEDHPAIIIATPEHRDLITDRLGDHGFDLTALRRRGAFEMLDARETLDLFLVNGTPDYGRFKAIISQGLNRLRRRSNSVIRAYGEMVDLLWREGNTVGAIRLEEMWNEVLKDYDLSLLCAYAMGNFYKSADQEAFRRICQTHTHVRPTESYSDAGDELRLVEITLLQQRAASLENEVRHRQELETRLRSTVAALNQREAEREQLLERERAARADAEREKAAAEQANRAKSEFLAVMSHELRTPLNAIGGYAELMQMGVHGPVTRGQGEALSRIQRSQQHLLGLINQVLNYARLESGNVNYDIEKVSVDEVLRTADALVMPQMRSKGVAYQYAPADRSLTVRADGEKLQQIVLNLLANAVKFTDRGGRIRVACEAVADRILIRVSDTGIGIPPEKLELIFDPFVQVDSNFTRTREGVGLGLAISRDLARGMGGDLRAQSTLHEGTTMTLTLPAGGS
jgi:signal transduction histidine kinase